MAKNKIEEEVTITPVIKDLERLFNRILRFLISIFSAIYQGLLGFLKFCFRNFLFLFIFSAVGVTIGYYSATLVKPTYSSDLVLDLNIDASTQLTADVKYFNSLIENKEFETLSKILQISFEEAHSLRGISIEGSSSYSHKMSSIYNFYQELDTIFQNKLEFETLLNSEIDEFDQQFTINLESKKRDVFSKVEPQLIVFFERVPELQKLRENKKNNLMLKKEVFLNQMSQLDTLKKVLNKVMVEQAKSKSEGSVTNISMDQKTGNDDFQLLDIYNRYLYYSDEVISINEVLYKLDSCYSVHSHFSNIGLKKGLRALGSALLFGLLFFLTGILILVAKIYRKTLSQ